MIIEKGSPQEFKRCLIETVSIKEPPYRRTSFIEDVVVAIPSTIAATLLVLLAFSLGDPVADGMMLVFAALIVGSLIWYEVREAARRRDFRLKQKLKQQIVLEMDPDILSRTIALSVDGEYVYRSVPWPRSVNEGQTTITCTGPLEE
jgi:hypothetical protein